MYPNWTRLSGNWDVPRRHWLVRTLGEKYGTEFVYLAPALLRQAEIYERRAETRQSLAYYRRFIVRWQDADPEYQSLVKEVSVRVGKLAIGVALTRHG